MAVLTLTGGQNVGHNEVPFLPSAAVAVTKSDADEFPRPVCVYVGVTGNVAVEPWECPGVSIVFVGVPAGGRVPVMVRKVLSTSTTASSMVAVY